VFLCDIKPGSGRKVFVNPSNYFIQFGIFATGLRNNLEAETAQAWQHPS
jgi:hypothetical protein